MRRLALAAVNIAHQTFTDLVWSAVEHMRDPFGVDVEIQEGE
jgi:hypothetical protein